MYLGEYRINDYVELVAVTHRFTSGAAYAPSSITYRIYENGATAAMIGDTGMTNFDGITGFYLNRVQITAAAGFEDGKDYVALIQATVDSVAAIDWRSFRVVNVRDVNVEQVNNVQLTGDGSTATPWGPA